MVAMFVDLVLLMFSTLTGSGIISGGESISFFESKIKFTLIRFYKSRQISSIKATMLDTNYLFFKIKLFILVSSNFVELIQQEISLPTTFLCLLFLLQRLKSLYRLL